MRPYVIIMAVALSAGLLFSCKADDQVHISGIVEHVDAEDVLLLKRLEFSTETLIDTLRTDEEGRFKYILKKGIEQPGYYYIYLGNRQVAALILQKGDVVTVHTTKDGRVSLLDGSEESALLQQINTTFYKAVKKFDSIYPAYEKASGKERDRMSLELGSIFIKYKQQAIRFLYQYPGAFVNTSVIFHSFPGQLYVFSDPKDAMLLKMVYDSLYTSHPFSPHTMAIRDRYESMEKALKMEHALLQAEVSDFPDICLPDRNGRMVCLSEWKGKSILLSFWHSTNVRMRLDNRELLDLYAQYAQKGLEIFQVALDNDKAVWASSVKDQDIPWISVCDGMGIYSSSVTSYNVVEIPTFFIINKQGDIVTRVSHVDEAIAEIKRLF